MTAMEFYPFLVAAHVTAVVFLVGGMLAQDRMVRAMAACPQERQAALLVILLRLDRRVTAPALLLAWIFGLSLTIWAGWFPSGWLVAKLAFVIALSALHGMQTGRLRRFARDGKPADSLPGAGPAIVVMMAAIAVLAFVKPF